MIDVLRLRTHGVGPAFVREAFEQVVDPSALTWQELQDVFDRAGGPYSYGLTSELRAHGIDAVDLVLDLTESRLAWEREHGSLGADSDLRRAHAIAAIKRLRPRIVIDLNMKTFDVDGLRQLRHDFPFVQGTVGIANVMKRLDRAFGHDLVLTPSRPLLRELRRHRGPAGEFFHHAFDPSGRTAPAFDGRDLGVVFSGSIKHGRYEERSVIVEALLEAGLIDAWVQEQHHPGPVGALERGRSARRWAREKRWLPSTALASVVRATGRGTGALDARLQQALGLDGPQARSDTPVSPGSLADRFPGRCHAAVHGSAMFDLLGRANAMVHHEVFGSAASLRMFETTGMGTALVTNAVEGLDELFTPGEEVLAYRTVGEAVAIVRNLVEDPSLARDVAAAGRRRTLRDHTVSSRATELAAILHDRFGIL
jgi:spore maturation protein CgeB